MYAGRAVPLILFACMPPGQKAHHMAEVHGAPLHIKPATGALPLRGLLALLLRSIASTEEALNYCSLVKQPAGRYAVQDPCSSQRIAEAVPKVLKWSPDDI